MLYFREYACSIIISLSLMMAGEQLGWPSPSLPKLLSPDTPIVITADDSSWIASLYQLGAILGPLLSILFLNRLGRKLIVFISTIPYIVALILILIAQSPAVLFVARFVAGIGFSVSSIAVTMYVGEIASDKIRGAAGVLISTMMKLGILFVYCVGPYVDFRTLPYIMLTPLILLLPALFWIPETPIYYLTKDNEDAAMKSLRFLRTNKTDIELESELETMYKVVKRSRENKVSFREVFGKKGNLKALVLMLGCQTGMHASGSMAYLSYAQQIFDAAEGVLGDSESAIIIGVVQVIGTLVSTVFVDKLGRRPLILSSIAGALICNTTMGTYFFYKDYLHIDTSSVSSLPIIVFIVFMSLYNIGLSTVSIALLAEYFAINFKAIAMTIIIIYGNSLAFAVTKLFQVISDAYGIYVSFWSFSVLSSAVFVFIYLLLPETKGVSLDEIQQRLNKKTSKSAAAIVNTGGLE